MKTKLFVLIPFVSLALTACGSDVKDILMPTGAPTLPMYNFILDGKAEVTTKTADIPGQLLTGQYNYIVFDSTKAQAKLNAEGENAKYEFARMLTGGNFHLFGFGKTENDMPTDNDYIIGFNEQATPGLMFKKLYKETRTKAFDENKDGVSAVKDVLTGINAEYKTASGQKIDWALVAEPVASALKGAFAKKSITGVLDVNLQAAFKERVPEWDKDYICQAGLYVNKDFKKNHAEDHTNFMKKLSDSVDKLFTNLDDVYKVINEKFDTEEKVTNSFGVTTAAMSAAQGQNSVKNGLGVIPNNVTFTVEDINNFNNLLK